MEDDLHVADGVGDPNHVGVALGLRHDVPRKEEGHDDRDDRADWRDEIRWVDVCCE